MRPEDAREVARNASACCAELSGPNSREAISRLTSLDSDVDEAIGVLAADDLEPAFALIGAMREYWVLMGRQASALELVATVLDQGAAAPPTRERAAALVCAGTLAFFGGENDRAAGYHSDALALARALGDAGITADALIGLARVAMQREMYGEMRRHAKASAATARKLGDDARLAVAIHHDAVGADLEGDADGKELHLETLEIERSLGNQRGIALELLNLGLVALNGLQAGEARRRLREALAIFTDLGVRRNVALSLALLGVAASDEGDATTAAGLLGKGLSLRRELQTTFTVGAERHIERALQSCREVLGEERLQELLTEGELKELTTSPRMRPDK
jgi:tetratricopeptide (TPR) repeat protein